MSRAVGGPVVAPSRRAGARMLAGGFGLLVWSACTDPLKPPALVADTRVLGARLEVAGEPDRAWPAPGEGASVRWLVGEPADPRPLGWHFDVCPSAPTMRSVPRCAASPFATATLLTAGLGEPRVAFVVPGEERLGDAEQILVRGIVCAGGVPDLGAPWPRWRCLGEGAAATIASFEATVQRGELGNRNPSTADDAVLLDGVDWPAPTVPTGPVVGCSALPPSPTVPWVHADGGEHVVSYRTSAADREALVAETSLSASRESLHVAHLSTAGELEGLFSVVEGDDLSEAPVVEVVWTAPTVVGPEGWRTRFYFVLRDGRGGADWTAREACVVP